MIRTDAPVFLSTSDVAAIVGKMNSVIGFADETYPPSLGADICADYARQVLRIIEHAQTGDYKAGQNG